MATPQCFQAAGVSRCSREHSSASLRPGRGAGLRGQRPRDPAQPRLTSLLTLFPVAGRGSGCRPPQARPTRSGRRPRARRPHRDARPASQERGHPLACPFSLETTSPQGLALLQPIPSVLPTWRVPSGHPPPRARGSQGPEIWGAWHQTHGAAGTPSASPKGDMGGAAQDPVLLLH